MNRTPSTLMAKTLFHDTAPTDNSLIYTDVIDAQQYDGGHLTIDVFCSATGAAVDIDSIALYESDASGSGYAAVTGADFTALTTANDGVLQSASVQCRARKRYMKVGYNPGAANDADFNVLFTLIGASETSKNADAYVFEL